MKPTVSVVVATYRRDAALERALESLAAQTYQDFEIVLVDDNSHQEWNGRVKGIIDRFQEKYPQIPLKFLVNSSNQGSARTRNLGIEVADGEYICFLDDDDLYGPKRIENQLIPMQREKADYSVTNLALFSESEKWIETRTRDYIKETSPEQLLKYHLLHHITGTDTMMFRREYLLKIGCFTPIDVGDEFYLMQKAIEGKGAFLHVPVCDVKAYVHTGEDGLSSGKSKVLGENLLYEHKKKYFALLEPAERRNIRMRHHAVLAYAYLRMKKYGSFVAHGVMAGLIDPIHCVKLLKK